MINQIVNTLAAMLVGGLLGYIISHDAIRKDCEYIGKANVLKNNVITCKVFDVKTINRTTPKESKGDKEIN